MIEFPKAKDKINPYIKVNFQKIHGIFFSSIELLYKGCQISE